MKIRERIYHKGELADSIVKRFIDDLKEYVKAVRDEEALSSSSTDSEATSEFEAYMKRLATRFEGREVTLTRREYWGFVIKAKIEILDAIGGLDFMRGIYELLEVQPDNTEYGFAAAFDELADGIGGWYRAI